MTIDNEIMLQLERLATLELTESERENTITQMNAVLSCLEVLCHAPTPPPQDDAAGCALREDTVQPSADRAELLANSSKTDGEFFFVPRTVE